MAYVWPSPYFGGSSVSDLGFQIGKELGELKARLEQLEGKKDCRCRGKAKVQRQPACKETQAAFKKLIATLAELNAVQGGEKLFLKNVIFTRNPDLAATADDDVYCCYASNGDKCCGPTGDDFCYNYCQNN